MRNSRSSPIFKHKDTTGLLWVEYAIYAALYRATTDVGIEKLTWLTGDQANQEERNEFHAGLYWVDTPGEDDERTRLLLPNYFNSFREELKQGAAYSNFIGNRGTVLELLGRKNEAQLHFREAEEFSP